MRICLILTLLFAAVPAFAQWSVERSEDELTREVSTIAYTGWNEDGLDRMAMFVCSDGTVTFGIEANDYLSNDTVSVQMRAGDSDVLQFTAMTTARGTGWVVSNSLGFERRLLYAVLRAVSSGDEVVVRFADYRGVQTTLTIPPGASTLPDVPCLAEVLD